MRALTRPLLVAVLSFALVIAPLGGQMTRAMAAPAEAGGPGTSADDAGCRVDNEDAFRAAIKEVTSVAFKNALAKIDFSQIVRDQWHENAIATQIDQLIDQAAETVKEQTAWDDLLSSLADRDKARALAESVAERVYRSDAFKKAVEDVATDTGREVAGYIELATIDAAVPAVRCVRCYLGSKYGSGIARIVADDTRAEFQPASDTVSADVSSGDIALAGGEALAGVMILLVRRMLTRMARRVGQRVVGAVLSRIVSVIAGGVGVVLIAKDIWDFRHGVLPIIVEEMKSETSKDAVRGELTAAISEQISAQVDDVAGGMADRIVQVWREFRAAHSRVVDIAARHDRFRDFVNGVARDDLPRVDRIVGLILEGEGEGGVIDRLGNGTLDEAVRRLPPEAVAIAGDLGGLAAGFAWYRLAGVEIAKVAKYDIHRAAKPEEFSPSDLGAVLAVADRLAISRLVALTRDERRPLLEVETGRLRTLARRHSEGELRELAGYLNGLTPANRKMLLLSVVEDPRRLKVLAGSGVRSAVFASRNQTAAINVLMRASGPLDVFGLSTDFNAVMRGDVSAYLLWAKHPYVVGALGFAVAILFLILRRLIFGRRAPRQPKSRRRRAEEKEA